MCELKTKKMRLAQSNLVLRCLESLVQSSELLLRDGLNVGPLTGYLMDHSTAESELKPQDIVRSLLLLLLSPQ